MTHPTDNRVKLLTRNDPKMLNAHVFDHLMVDLIKGVLEAIYSEGEEEYVNKYVFLLPTILCFLA
jgi:pyruvate/2-oxoglutarate dehydrogenase complex dihydrolipoamide dehydrogenase (E3) component